MRASAAVREAWRDARAHRVTTLVLILVAFAMTCATFLTAGRAAAVEAELAASVDAAGPRLLTVTVVEPSPGMPASAVSRLAAIGGVEWLFALGPAHDVRSAQSGARTNVAARAILTEIPDLVQMELGRLPQPGEAIIGAETQRRLQLLEPVGSILEDGVPKPIVGRYSADGVIADLERLVLTRPGEADADVATLIYVLAADAAAVAGIGEQIRALAGVPADQLVVDSSPELVALGQALSGSLGALSRQLAVGAILVGMALVALVMTLALNARRRDFGRRRALGAGRTVLMAVTLIEVVLPLTAGATIGAAAGVVGVAATAAFLPPAAFVLAGVTLIVVAGALSAVPSVLLATLQDPMRILRVP